MIKASWYVPVASLSHPSRILQDNVQNWWSYSGLEMKMNVTFFSKSHFESDFNQANGTMWDDQARHTGFRKDEQEEPVEISAFIWRPGKQQKQGTGWYRSRQQAMSCVREGTEGKSKGRKAWWRHSIETGKRSRRGWGGGKGRKQHRYLKHSQGILQVVISNFSNFHESHNLPKLIKVKILTCFLSTSKIKLKIFSHTAVSKVRQPHWKSKCLTANC